jgi:hypothetical protein
VFWSQTHKKTDPINNSLTGLDLLNDFKQRLHLFLEIEVLENSPTLLVGLDSIEHLFIQGLENDVQGVTLLLDLLKDLYIVSQGHYKMHPNIVDHNRIRLLFFVTGRTSTGLNDADSIFSNIDTTSQ